MVSIYHLSFSPDLPLWLKNGKISPFPLRLLATPSTPSPRPSRALDVSSYQFNHHRRHHWNVSCRSCVVGGWMNDWLTDWLVLRLPFLYSAVAPVIQFRIKITFISHYTQMTGAAGADGGIYGALQADEEMGRSISQSDCLAGWASEWVTEEDLNGIFHPSRIFFSH